MRLIEGLILLAILFSLLAFFVPKGRRPRWLLLLPVLVALLVVIHLVVEGYRWQMVPAYALAAILVVSMVWGIAQKGETEGESPYRGRRILVITGIVLGLILLVLSAQLLTLSPVFSLPEPAGPHAVGTQYFYWTDEERTDESSTGPGSFREVSVQIWYPAELSGDEEAIPYMRQDAARVLARSWGIPEFMFDHHALVHTHAALDAAMAETGAPFPVITYSTSGLMSSHMSLFEELASQGYVVLCIGHPYWNPYVFGSGGEALPFDGENALYKAWWAEEETDEVKKAKEQISLAKTMTAQEHAQRRHNELKPLAIHDLALWAGDIGFVLDELELLNQCSESLAGALDLQHVGIMGFSKGGAAAGQFCLTDERCQAGINLTGFMYGDVVEANLDRPFLFVSQEDVWCPDCYVNDLFYKRAESDAYQMKIRGARHTSFGDPCLWGELISLSDDEPAIACERMVAIQNIYTLAFFDKQLKGRVSSLLDGPSAEFPELIFRSNNNAG
jgi:predicted dienelactone hydrolase